MWACFSVFVVYGTTFPFAFDTGGRGFSTLAHRINWRPLGGTADNLLVGDIIQNILLFIPFGVLGYFSLVFKRSWTRKAAIVLAGSALSLSVETLQIFSVTRFPAVSDVVFNTLGTALGIFLAMAFKKSVLGFKSHPTARKFIDAPSAFPAFIFLVLVAAGCWQPFDFALDISLIKGHLKPLLFQPLQFQRPDEDMVSFIRFLFAALFLSRFAAEARLPSPVLAGAGIMAALGLGLEMSQTIIQSRAPGVQDALVAVAGAIAGGIAYLFPGFHLRPRIWSAVGGSMILMSAAVRALYPFEFSPDHAGINLLPFLSLYERTTFAAIGDFMESAMIFFPLGFLLGYFYPRIRPSALAALAAGAMALSVEAVQGFVPGRYADLTDVLGAMVGGMAGGLALTRGWPAFREYMARDDDNQV